MINLIKSHPWTFGIGCAVLLAAIVGVIVAVVTKGGWKDRGLMTTDDGKPYKWSRENFPLGVWLHPDLPDAYYDAFIASRAFIHGHAKAVLFDQGTELPADFDIERLGEGQVVIAMSDVANPERPDHGNTALTVMPTGEIKRAVVSLPPARNAVAKPITLHELMHVLGYDHDESITSLMAPRLSDRPQQITDLDKQRLTACTDTSFKLAGEDD